MNKFFKWADDMTPVGIDGKKELGWAAAAFGLSLFESLTFFISLYAKIDDLYMISKATGRRILDPDSYMPDLSDFAPSYIYFFLLTALVFLTLSGYHYIYHYQGAKSIYTMRRLPDRWELHRRCLVFTLTVAVICILMSVIMLGAYLWAYNTFVPPARLRPGQLKTLINTLFGGAR